jgi:PKD repeat protein
MNRIVIVTLSLVLFLGLSSAVQGQHFEFTRTDGNASILVSEALFNGEDLVADDEIGVFTEAGLCAGASVVNEPGAQLGISAFGDEAGGEVDGFAANEPFAYRFWDHEAEAEIGNVEAQYAVGNGRYSTNSFHVVNLSAAADAPPILVEPEEVDFGNVGVGEQADDVVVVTNVGDEPFMITNVGVDGDGFSAEFEGGGGGGEEFPWEFTRTDANMSVLVQSAQIDGEDIVAGDYVGVFTGDGLCAGFSEVQEAGAQLGVAAFGDEAGGEVDGFAARELIRFRMWDSEGGFEVAVDGDDVEIGGGENAWVSNGFLVVSLSGDAPAQGVTLDPEDTLEIPVHFNPENAGDHNGTLTINTNIEGFGEVDVPLSGNGEEERFPAINVSTDAINFEDLEVGDSADQTFTISNEGDADLNVDGVTVESDHFSVDVDGGFTLEPGQDRVVTATFGPQDAGDHAAEVMITSDDPSNGDLTVALSGSAFFVPMILVEPADGIDFGDVPVGEAGHAVAEISNIGRVPFIVSDVFVNGDGFSVDFEGGGGGDGDEIDWEFTRTDANMSVLVQSAQIDGEDISAGDFVGVFTGDGLCAGFSEVQEAGAQLGVAAFGDEAGGEVDGFAARELIRFRMWDTEAGFEVMVDEDDVEIGGGENAWVANGFVVVSLSAAAPQQGVVLQPDEMIEVDVHFNPGEAGDFDGSLVVASNVPDNEEVAIGLSGTGIAARDIDVTPGELGFDDLYVGEEADMTFTISNTGEVDLQVESVSVESDHFSVNVNGGFTLGGGEERDVTVTFAPQDEGDHEADVMIVSDDPDEGEVSVHVMGTGMWFAMIRLDPDDVVDFGEVFVDDEAEGTLTIHNDGRATLVLGDINIEGDGFSININAEPADFDWEFERTDGNMSIIVGSALIGEDDAAEGDAVGVFTENGLCAGYSIVREPGEQMGVSAFAAEPQDDNGFQNGEEINYRIFDEDAGVEYSANAEYNAGNGEFQVNGFAAVSLVADEMLRGGAIELGDVEPGGSVELSIFFSPDAEGDYNGSITIASNDPFNGEVSVDLTGSARNRNTPPELDDVGDQEVDEGQELVIDLSAFDAEEDDLEFGHNGLPEGAEFDGNTFMWTPSFDQAGDYEVTFTVSDGEFDDDETITIMVNNVNRRPVVDSPIRDVEVNEDDQRLVVIDNLNNVFSDPDGDELSFEVFGSDDLNLEITNGNRLSLRPEANYFGESDVTVTASDGGDGQAAIVVNMNLGNDRRANARRNVRSISADAPDRDESVDDEFHVTVNPINDAPVLSEIGGQEVDEGQELSFELDANDVDNEDLEFNANDLPEGAELNGNTFTWTPSFAQAGQYTVTFSVSDGELEDSEEVTINVNNVNRAPVLSEIGAQEVNENQELTISLEASDADDDDLEFGHEGLPEGAEFDGNTFTWTPSFNQAGDYEVTFTVTDGEAGDSETVSISVNNVNRAPVLADIGDQEVDEGQELAGTLEADDADNDDLEFGHRGLPEGAELNGADFTWTPGFDQAGDYTITFTVTDGEDEDSEEVSITVNNVNRPPTLGDFNDGNHLEGEEGETFEFTVEGSDPDGGDLSFEMTSDNLPDGLFADNGNNTASFSWETTSDDGSNEDYSGTVTVSDGEASASIDFTITVINVISLQFFTDFAITDVSHSIIIPDITDEDETVPTEWEVGVFTPDGLLAGAEVWDAEADGGIGVAAWGDDANTEEIDGFNTGEQLNFRLWDFEADEEMGARAELLNGTRTWESNGFSIFTLSTATTVEITIEFVNGWNMISINVSPGEEYYNPDREDPGPDTILMLEQLSDGDDHAIVIFKNDRGAFYSPPNNFRNLYFWDLEEGYSCRTNTAINGTWLGEPIPANTEFPIFRNWNFIPYYPDYELPAGSREDFYVLQSIIDHVIIAKNGQGRFMAPRVPFSNMPPWRMTQGYQVKVDEDLEFSYPGPFGGGDVFLGGDNLKANQHYTEPTITGDNMSVLIKAVNGYRIGYYDQIAAYTTDGRLVGSGNFEENGAAGIAVWGDDPTTDAIDGLLKDEAFELRLWNSDEKIESRLDAVKLYEGELKYSTDGFLMLNVAIEAEIPQDYYLSKAYPNPFNATTHLTYGMPEEGYVSIKVYDLRGGLVETIVEGVASAGKHAITWGGNDIASGVYIVRLAVGSTQLSRKVVLMR